MTMVLETKRPRGDGPISERISSASTAEVGSPWARRQRTPMRAGRLRARMSVSLRRLTTRCDERSAKLMAYVLPDLRVGSGRDADPPLAEELPRSGLDGACPASRRLRSQALLHRPGAKAVLA